MKTNLLSSVLLLISVVAFAQVEQSSQLFKTIKQKDSLLFNIGFNTCDISQFENIVSEDFEFYHDTAGITSSKEQFLNMFKEGVCNLSYKATRKLEEKSLEVFALKRNGNIYGAIQNGVHRFYATEVDTLKYFTSIAKFSNVWLMDKGKWKLSRSISYDHKTEDTPVNESLLFKDKNETERWLIREGIPNLGIGVINDGELIEASVYGTLKNGKSATTNAVFNVASLTKPVTAMVALKLAVSNKWNIDEPIYKLFNDPDIQEDPRSKLLTTRHILSHQTGFPNWRWNTETGTLAFEFNPGTAYQYSGEGFEILRKALEQQFSKNLNLLSKALIFEPTNMKSSSHFWEKHINEELFVGNFNTNGVAYNLDKYYSANGADDLLTTIEDYGRFLIGVISSDGLSPNIFSEMVTPQVETKKNKHFGLGFEVYPFEDGNYALSHGGSDKGVQALIFIIPNTKKGLIIFTNVDDGYKVFAKAISHYLPTYGQEIINTETGN